MKTVLVVAFIVTAVALVAGGNGCRGDGNGRSEATPVSAETTGQTPSPTVEPTPTPTAGESPAASVSAPPLRLEDARIYLDASAILSGFTEVDPSEEGLSNIDLGLGPNFSETVLYMSDEPFQLVLLYMGVVSGEIGKAADRALLRDEKQLEETLLLGFLNAAPPGTEQTVRWSDPSVGDVAKLARITAEFAGVEVLEEILFFIQEEGPDAVDVFILNVWLPGEPPIIDTLSVGEHVSARITNP